MPITKTKQKWEVGSTVKVGFLTLTVTGFSPTPGDGLPDVYFLKSAKGVAYKFTPHIGLEKEAAA